MDIKFVVEILQGAGVLFVLAVVGVTGWVIWKLKKSLKG